MSEKKPYMVGNVRLSDLNGFEDTVKGGVRGCFIPYDQNPSLYLGANRQTGAMTLDVDILIRETTASKTGASHFIKLSVGKANRERFHMTQEAVDSLKIVGNIYTRTPKPAEQASRQAAPAPQGSFQGLYQAVPSYGQPPQGGYPTAATPPQASYPAPAPAQSFGAPAAPQGGYPAPPSGAGW